MEKIYVCFASLDEFDGIDQPRVSFSSEERSKKWCESMAPNRDWSFYYIELPFDPEEE